MEAPLRHHFLPEFYLKQWAEEDGRLVEYKKPYGNTVKPRRTHPKGTGFIFRLYAVEGLSDDVAHEMETEFLSPVDSRAAQALTAMLADKEFSAAQRLAWASFVATLLSRMPEDVDLVKQIILELAQTILPGFQPIFESHKPEGETRTFQQMTDELVGQSNQRAMNFARRIMSNDRLIRGIAAMEWSILTVERAKFALLTSDRPVIYTNYLGSDQSHIVLPVGPRRLFVAVKDRKLIDQMRVAGENALVVATNGHVVGAADKYVYGINDSQLRFVQNRMGTARVPTLIERMHALQRQHYGSVLKGLADAANHELGL
jgi:hypothetical protein